jgi:Tol biopolymer transport system component
MKGSIMASLVAAFACVVIAAPAADASFPGRNGVIAFSRLLPQSNASRSAIWTVNPRSGQLRQLTKPSRRCPPNREWTDADPSYSASGRLIVYSHWDSCDPRWPDGLYLMRSDGSARQFLRRPDPDDELEVFESPTLSPDARWVAVGTYLDSTFILNRSRPRGRRMNIVYEFAGLRRYTEATQPSWGANGRVALTLNGEWSLGDMGHIGTISRKGTDLRLATRSRRDAMADWSPRADRIAFQRHGWREGPRAVEGDVFVAPARQRAHRRSRRPTATRLTATRDSFLPAWSPNGRQIAYVRVPNPRAFTPVGSLWIMRANDGGGQRLVATGLDADISLGPSQISWQPRPR